MPKTEQNENYRILFVCSPSLGILDSWISVLIALKAKLPNAQFMFIASKTGTIEQIHLNQDLKVLAEKIFDSVVFRTDSGVLLKTVTFNDAIKLNTSSKIRVFHYGRKIAKRLKIKFLDDVISSIYKDTAKRIYSKKLYETSSLIGSKYVTLFDVSQLDRPYNSDFYNIITNRQNFSILHGTGIAGIRASRQNRKKLDIEKSIAYLFSEKEVPYYKYQFGLTSKQIRVYGIPKHQKKWIEKLSNTESISDKKYIFLISRSVNESFTSERRKLFLEMIKDIAVKYQLKIIIKPHPNETISKQFKEIFDLGKEIVDWEVSYKHTFLLGKYCEFAVCFYSGVPLDLIQLGVPTIELSNFTGLNIDDNKSSLRSPSGEAVYEYRYLNLVLGASTYSEFEKHVLNIINNKELVVDKLLTEYKQLFPMIDNVDNLIAEEIACIFIQNSEYSE